MLSNVLIVLKELTEKGIDKSKLIEAAKKKQGNTRQLSVLKKELVYLEKFKTRKEATEQIFEYIACFYNGKKDPFLHRLWKFAKA